MFKERFVFITGNPQPFMKIAKTLSLRIETTTSYLVKKIEKCSLVLFSGGEDIDPNLYGDSSPFNVCFRPNKQRDAYEREIFEIALESKIPMIGICRGMQFLHVLNGGTLLHHINNHDGSYHRFSSKATNSQFSVNSLHHQMVVPNKKTIVIGKTPHVISTIHIGKKDDPVEAPKDNVEAIVIPTIRAAGVQYHPEFMFPMTDGYNFFIQMARNLIKLNINDFVNIYTEIENIQEYKVK